MKANTYLLSLLGALGMLHGAADNNVLTIVNNSDRKLEIYVNKFGVNVSSREFPDREIPAGESMSANIADIRNIFLKEADGGQEGYNIELYDSAEVADHRDEDLEITVSWEASSYSYTGLNLRSWIGGYASGKWVIRKDWKNPASEHAEISLPGKWLDDPNAILVDEDYYQVQDRQKEKELSVVYIVNQSHYPLDVIIKRSQDFFLPDPKQLGVNATISEKVFLEDAQGNQNPISRILVAQQGKGSYDQDNTIDINDFEREQHKTDDLIISIRDRAVGYGETSWTFAQYLWSATVGGESDNKQPSLFENEDVSLEAISIESRWEPHAREERLNTALQDFFAFDSDEFKNKEILNQLFGLFDTYKVEGNLVYATRDKRRDFLKQRFSSMLSADRIEEILDMYENR